MNKTNNLLSPVVESTLVEFDDAAQRWGIESDQGSGANVARAEQRYKEALAAMRKVLLRLARDSSSLRKLKKEDPNRRHVAYEPKQEGI